MTIPILTTKLYVPPPRSELVSRPRLIEQLHTGLSSRLVLLSAPAGFGKSTLLSEWVPSVESPLKVAWLSLDDGDNDLARFLAYLVAALQSIDSAIGEELATALQSPRALDIELGLTTLLNDIAASPTEAALILDDYHVIESQAVDRSLTFLIDHSPANLHLVIATRADPALPLARLRGQGQLTELRTADLRFTLDEVAVFLNQVMALKLAAEDIAVLEARTEGWIVGLQLAALSMRESKDVAAFIRSFSGSHHHILDYLVEEVLGQQSVETQNFLLQTSILERLTGPLCDSVCIDEPGPSEGRATLERLAKANLFIVPLDSARRWYRYHHLFADLLQARLRLLHPDRIKTLHLRAIAWFEENGLAAEAIEHAFSAGEYDRAASLIEQNASRTMNLGRVTTLLRWLDALPKTVLGARPRLGFIRAWALSMAGQPRAAEEILLDLKTTLASLPSTAENRALRGELSAILAGIITSGNDPHRIIQEAEEALTYLPEENLLSRARATLALGIAYAYSDEVPNAIRTYQQSRDLALGAQNPFLATVAIELIAGIQIYHQGSLAEAARNLEQALEWGKRKHGTYYAFTGLAHSLLAEINLEWNELAAATRYLETGLDLVQRGGIGHSLVHTYCAQARLKMVLGETEAAREALRTADQAAQANPLMQFLIHNLACQAKLALHLGDTEAALRWASGSEHKFPKRLPVHLHEFQQIALARVYLTRDDIKRTLETLALIHPQAESAGRTAHLIEISILEALAYQALNDSAAAVECLQAAINLAAPEGYVQMFLEHGEPMARLLRGLVERGMATAYANKLLTAYEAQKQFVDPESRTVTAAPERTGRGASPLTTSPLIEPLTDRELEVLHLMADGLTYNEIAGQITVSLNTVRTHVKNIYSKLLVHKRSEALSRARDLDLL
jgi:LuxR family maltose regulon positive regulatory protein